MMGGGLGVFVVCGYGIYTKGYSAATWGEDEEMEDGANAEKMNEVLAAFAL